MAEGIASLHFKHDLSTYWVMNMNTPELGVAYDEVFLRNLHKIHNMGVEFHPGGWSEGFGTGSQDMVIARRM